MKKIKLYEEFASNKLVTETFRNGSIEELHFETDAKKAEKLKLAIGASHGMVTNKTKIEDADYSLNRFRKEIGFGNKDEKYTGVFLPGSYSAAISKLGDGPHAKAVKKIKWNQKKYDQWLEDVASNDGWKNAYDMAQNASSEPGLINWVKKEFRGDDPLQRIQWDIEGFAESVVTEGLVVYNSSNTDPKAAKQATKEFGKLLPKANKGVEPYVFAVIKTKARNYRLAIKSGSYVAHEFMSGLQQDGILTADIVKKAVANVIKLNPEEFNESVVTESLTIPTMAAMLLGLGIATRIGLMSDEKYTEMIGSIKPTAKAIIKNIPIIGDKIRNKELKDYQTTEVEKYLNDEITDKDIVEILKENPKLKKAIEDVSINGSNYKEYYRLIKEIGGAANQYGDSHRKFKKLRKKLSDGKVLEMTVTEGNKVTFTLDDGDLDDKFLSDKGLSRNLDYKEDGKDSYYVLPKRDFDRLQDWADSSGYDTDEVIDVIDESVINEAKSLNRAEMTDLLDKHLNFLRTSEEFDGATGGIWTSAENGETLSGSRIFDYYSESSKYEFGVLNKFAKLLSKNGWYAEFYDPGTVMIWEE